MGITSRGCYQLSRLRCIEPGGRKRKGSQFASLNLAFFWLALWVFEATTIRSLKVKLLGGVQKSAKSREFGNEVPFHPLPEALKG